MGTRSKYSRQDFKTAGKLSTREKDVLRLRVQDYTLSAICNELKISRSVLDTALESALDKLMPVGADWKRTDLIAHAKAHPEILE